MEELGSGIDLNEAPPEELYDEGEGAEVEEASEPLIQQELNSAFTTMPRGSYLESFYRPPEMERALYLRERTKEAYQTDYEEFEEMDESRFMHAERNLSVNLYPRDTRRVMQKIYEKANIGRWMIVNGTQSTRQGLTNAHTAGLAVDVAVKDYAEARRLADAAYMVGCRAIAIQGCQGDNGGYVHIDIGPAAQWAIDGKVYRGPGI